LGGYFPNTPYNLLKGHNSAGISYVVNKQKFNRNFMFLVAGYFPKIPYTKLKDHDFAVISCMDKSLWFSSNFMRG